MTPPTRAGLGPPSRTPIVADTGNATPVVRRRPPGSASTTMLLLCLCVAADDGRRSTMTVAAEETPPPLPPSRPLQPADDSTRTRDSWMTSTDSRCPLPACWDQFQTVKKSLGIVDVGDADGQLTSIRCPAVVQPSIVQPGRRPGGPGAVRQTPSPATADRDDGPSAAALLQVPPGSPGQRWTTQDGGGDGHRRTTPSTTRIDRRPGDRGRRLTREASSSSGKGVDALVGGTRSTEAEKDGDLRRRLCVALRAFAACVDRADEECRGQLSYHSLRRITKNKLDRCNCSSTVGDQYEDMTPHDDPSTLLEDDGSRPSADDKDDCTSYRRRSCSSSSTSLCVVYGDPHVRTFDGRFQTCRVLGTWPLIDNQYVTVQTTNARMGWANGTAVSKVSIIIKNRPDCAVGGPGDDGVDGGSRYLVYVAEDGRLPSTWRNDDNDEDDDDDDNLVHPEQSRFHLKGVDIVEVVPAEQVDIGIAYINTSISLKLVGRYYSVSISMPSEIDGVGGRRSPGSALDPSASATSSPSALSSTSSTSVDHVWIASTVTRSVDASSSSLQPPHPQSSSSQTPTTHRLSDPAELAAVQLCVTGCPDAETVDLAEFFWQTAHRSVKAKRTPAVSGGGTPKTTQPAVLPLATAVRTCSNGDDVLGGPFLDSCVFDLLNTGDVSFSQTAARWAVDDHRRRRLFDAVGGPVDASDDDDTRVVAVVAAVLERHKAAEVTSSSSRTVAFRLGGVAFWMLLVSCLPLRGDIGVCVRR